MSADMWGLWQIGERLRVARAYALAQDPVAVLRFGLRLEREIGRSDADAFLVGLQSASSDLEDVPPVQVMGRERGQE